MTALEIALGAGCCLLAGMLLVLCWLVRSQAADLDIAQRKAETLIAEREQVRSAAEYWKQECLGATADEDPIARAVEAAARGIDLAGIDENNLSVLKANHEPLTDEEREQLDERFGAITRGEIPYVQGIEEEG